MGTRSIISGDFFDYDTTDVSSRSQSTGYNDENVRDYWDLYRHFRANDATTNNWLLKIDMGTATALDAIFLNDVNFNQCSIQRSTDNSNWYDVSGGTVTMPKDARVQRYKAYIELNSFNYRYIRVFIPTGTTLTDSLAVWRIGTVCLLQTDGDLTFELTRDFSYPFTHAVTDRFASLLKTGGSGARVELGDKLIWAGELSIGPRRVTDFADFWKISAFTSATPIIYYENDGDISHAYLCVRDTNVAMKTISHDMVIGGNVGFVELV